MKRLGLITLALALAWLPARPGNTQQPNPNPNPNPQPAPSAAPAGSVELETGLYAGPAVVFRNLAIYPLYSDAPTDSTNYLTLDEGLKEKLVEVREIGGTGNSAGNSEPQRDQRGVPRRPAHDRQGDPPRAEPVAQPAQSAQPMQRSTPPAVQPGQPAPVEQQQPNPPARPIQRQEMNAPNQPAPQQEGQFVEQQQQQDSNDNAAPAPLINRILAALQSADAADRPALFVAAQLELIRTERTQLAAELALLSAAQQGQANQANRDSERTVRIAQIARRMENLAAQAEFIARQGIAPADMAQREQAQQREQRQQRLQNLRNGGSSARVNELEVENKSADRPLYLMTGEIVLGGQQDRIVAVDTIVPAKSKMEIRVFCVEPGRWNGGGQFGSGGAVVHGKLRQLAQDSKQQGEVWREVRETNGKMATSNSSETYRANLNNETLKKRMDEYIGHFETNFKIAEKMVGCIVAKHGKIVVIDRFGSNAIFKAMFPKLMKSFALGAIIVAHDAATANPNQSVDPNATIPGPALDAVKKTYTDARTGQRTRDDNGQTLLLAEKCDNDRFVGFRNDAVDPTRPAAEKRLLHESTYCK